MAYDAAQLQRDLQQGTPIRFDPAAPRDQRIIDSAWIAALANADAEIAQPIEIRHAVFPKALRMRFRLFQREVFLHDCTFEEEVDCNGTRFRHEVELTGSTFAKPVNLTRVHARMLRLTRCRFDDELKAFDLSVDESLHAAGADFGAAWFERLGVGKVAFFRPAFFNGRVFRTRFRGKANFNNASIKLEAEFDGVVFEEEASFRRARIEGNALFRAAEDAMIPGGSVPIADPLPAVFHGEANFRGATIGGDLAGIGVVHGGPATYAGITVSGRALFLPSRHGSELRPATFHGPVTFDHATFEQGAEFRGAQFAGDATFAFATFHGDCDFSPPMRLGSDESVSRPRCSGTFDFRRCVVTGDARFIGMQFEKEAIFDLARVSGNASFNAAPPHAAVAFGGMVSLHGFEAASLGFAGARCGEARFHWMKVGTANFETAEFEGKAQFAGATFSGRAAFVKTVFRDRADFTACEAKGPFIFQRTQFHGAVSFVDATFDFLALGTKRYKGHAEFGPATRVDCTGMTFRRIYADLLTLLPRTEPYDRQVYVDAARHLRSIGETELAGKVYHQQRRRETQASWRRVAAVWRDAKLRRPSDLFWSAVHAFVDSLEQALSFVGVSPLRMAATAIGVLLLGGLVFAQKDAVMLKDGAPDKVPDRPPAAAAPARPRAPIATTQATVLAKTVPITNAAVLPPPPVHIAPTPCAHCRRLSVARAFGFSLRMFMPVGDLPVATRYIPSEQPLAGGLVTYDGFAALERALGLLFVPLAIAAFTSVLLGRDK